MVQPWWVQIAVCATTVPLAAASRTGASPGPTTSAPAASTSATDANGVPVGAVLADEPAALDEAAEVAAELAELGEVAEVAELAEPADEAGAELWAAELLAGAAELAVDVGSAAVPEEPHAAAVASSAVPDAARTVLRGSERGDGVTGGPPGDRGQQPAFGAREMGTSIRYSLRLL